MFVFVLSVSVLTKKMVGSSFAIYIFLFTFSCVILVWEGELRIKKFNQMGKYQLCKKRETITCDFRPAFGYLACTSRVVFSVMSRI